MSGNDEKNGYDPYKDPESELYDPYADSESKMYDPYLDPDYYDEHGHWPDEEEPEEEDESEDDEELDCYWGIECESEGSFYGGDYEIVDCYCVRSSV